MQGPVTVVTEKVMGSIRGLIFMAMRVSYRRGATVSEITSFLNHWAPASDGVYQEGMVERVLMDLNLDGKVDQAGARWYPVGLAH